MFSEVGFKKAITLSEHYKAVGETRLYLHGEMEDMPWEFATSVVDGGMHRFVGSVSCRIEAAHESGLTFSWSLDYELSGASGSSTYQVNRNALRVALNRLPSVPRAQLKSKLSQFADAIREKAEEMQKYADSQFAQAESVKFFLARELDS